MSRIFVIPDIHLKPWIFCCAEERMREEGFDRAAVLGDLVDDWDQGLNLDLYNETFDAAILFAKRYPDTIWCLGNHDVSYVWRRLETGYSEFARDTVISRLCDLQDTAGEGRIAYVHRLDQVIFSHGGLTKTFMNRIFGGCVADMDEKIDRINHMGPDELWKDDSPLWARFGYDGMSPYEMEQFQVVGHTPVEKPVLTGRALICDTFSTYSNGIPIGNESFICIDSETCEYHEVSL